MYFADIHCHALAAVDDGAKSLEIMFSMLDAAHNDRVRVICFTPHWQPSVFGDNRQKAADAFSKALEYVSRRGYQMSLFLANELSCDMNALSYLSAHACKTLNGSKNVLVDFPEDESAEQIRDRLHSLLGAGFRPILAHTERYISLSRKTSLIRDLKLDGTIIQINADSILGKAGFGCRKRSRRLLDEQLADLVASDAHGIEYRPSMLKASFEEVCLKYGTDYAKKLFWYTPTSLLIPEKSSADLRRQN